MKQKYKKVTIYNIPRDYQETYKNKFIEQTDEGIIVSGEHGDYLEINFDIIHKIIKRSNDYIIIAVGPKGIIFNININN
jgi:hypothetical protein